MDVLVSHFLEEAPDLMDKEFEREGVKLHATVMNSSRLTLVELLAQRVLMREGVTGDMFPGSPLMPGGSLK